MTWCLSLSLKRRRGSARLFITVSRGKEISAARWNDWLEMLPPQGWWGGRGLFLVQVAGVYTEEVTQIFVVLNGRYFECRERIGLTHQKLIAGVKAVFPGVCADSRH